MNEGELTVHYAHYGKKEKRKVHATLDDFYVAVQASGYPRLDSSQLSNLGVENKNIVYLTSKVYTSSASFSYTKVRSLYTHEERFIQTLETIESVRSRIPDSFIVFCDNSKFPSVEHSTLKEKTDLFLNITDNPIVNLYTDFGQFKSMGESVQQLLIYEYFFKIIFKDDIPIQNVFKISARYVLNDEFVMNKFESPNESIMKLNDCVVQLMGFLYVYTCFYKLQRNDVENFFQCIETIIRKCVVYAPIDFENSIAQLFFTPYHVKQVEKLGLTQRIATDQQYGEMDI
jgi:hypothetical protein